jgi:hypothetical protein
MASATSLARYTGDVIVGTEVRPLFWILKPSGNGFVEMRLRDNLPPGAYSLEQAIVVR